MVRNLNIKNGPLIKNIIVFAMPLVLSGIFQLLFSAVDTMTIGRFLGSNYLAGIGATAPVIAFFSNSLIAFTYGVSVMVSRQIGEKRNHDALEIVGIVLAFSLLLGIAIGVLGIAITPFMLRVIDTPQEISGLSEKYLRIYMMGMPFFLFYNFGSAIIRSFGNTVISLVYVAVSGLCNVVLDIVFIKLGLGIAGVAVATIISQFLSAVLVYIYIRRQGYISDIRWEKSGAVISEAFRLGFPAGMQTMLLSLSNIIIQDEINKFGTTVIAGQTVYMSLNGFLLAAINAVTQTSIIFVAQNDAENNKHRVISATAYCAVLSFVLGSGLGLLMFLFKDALCLPYTDSVEVIAVVKILMPICAIPYGLCGIMESLSGSVRGLGKALSPTVMYLIGIGLFRILWIKIVLPEHNSIEGLFACYPVSWIVTSIFQLILFCVIVGRKYNKQ